MINTEKKTDVFDVLAQLWAIARDGGGPPSDDVCRYVKPDQYDGHRPVSVKPVCIVGQLLVRQDGLDLTPLLRVPEWNGKRFSSWTPAGLAEAGESRTEVRDLVRQVYDQLNLTPNARDAVAEVQRFQDNGTEWREAVARVWCRWAGLAPRVYGFDDYTAQGEL